MNRTEKRDRVDEIRQGVVAARHAFLVDFQGLTVTRDTELRSQLRKAQVDYRVVKNRLARLAVADTPFAALGLQFRGSTGIALAAGDPVAVAKVLVDFAKDNPALKIKGGLLDGGQTLSTPQIEALSALPPLPVMRARLLSAVQAPAARLVQVLAEPGRSLARLVDTRSEGTGTA
jgi:large subunit ribosomal protein L10